MCVVLCVMCESCVVPGHIVVVLCVGLICLFSVCVVCVCDIGVFSLCPTCVMRV